MHKSGKIRNSVFNVDSTYQQRLRDALEDVKTHGTSLGKAAVKWNISKTTLFKFKKNPERSFHRPPSIFSKDDEEKMAYWINECAKRGFPRSRADILLEAFKLRQQKEGASAVPPGRDWFDLFKRRHKFVIRKAESLSRASGNLCKSNLLRWYRQIEDGLKEEGEDHLLIVPSRIYNADESNFLLNPSSGNVVVPKEMKSVFELIKNDKAGLTVMLTVRADAKPCRPFIIYAHKRIPAAINNNFPHETADIGVTESGWMTSESFCIYLELLVQQAKADGVNMPHEKILLFVDNHASHLTLESCQKAAELGIILMSFYPNATFLYQPCDKTCFRSLKAHWKREVRLEKASKVDKSMSESSFARIFMKAFEGFAKDESVTKNGFRASGIYPWNAEAIDYSKCLGKETAGPEFPLENNFEHEEIISVPENATFVIDLSDDSNASLINEEKLIKVMADQASDPMVRELCRRELLSMLTPASVPAPLAPESASNVIIEAIEILPVLPTEPQSILVVPPVPERQNQRQVQRTSPLVSSVGNISRLVRSAVQKKEALEMKQQRQAERLAVRQQKHDDEAVKLVGLREKTGFYSQKENVSSGKVPARRTGQKRPLQQLSINKNAQNMAESSGNTEVPVKKPRGRPRKKPVKDDL